MFLKIKDLKVYYLFDIKIYSNNKRFNDGMSAVSFYNPGLDICAYHTSIRKSQIDR